MRVAASSTLRHIAVVTMKRAAMGGLVRVVTVNGRQLARHRRRLAKVRCMGAAATTGSFAHEQLRPDACVP